MAVSIDTVYQTVLAVANKEQRGYISPQQFNLFARQAQIKIFEQYFYDLNQFKRVPSTKADETNMISVIEEKISHFYNYYSTSTPTPGGSIDFNASYTDLYRLSEVRVNYDTTNSVNPVVCEEISLHEHAFEELGPLTAPSTKRPVFKRFEQYLTAYPTPKAADYPNGQYILTYLRKPLNPNWSYNIVVGQALYNSSNSVDFELHPSEETSLVNEILKLAGIMMEKPELNVSADREEDKKIQQEKS